MDGFFSRFAWTWLDRQGTEPGASATGSMPSASPRPSHKRWSKHSGHQRTFAPHRMSSEGRDPESGSATP
jgi:hypothetical protein